MRVIASVRACGIELLEVGSGDECMGPDGVVRPDRAVNTVVTRLQNVLAVLVFLNKSFMSFTVISEL